MMLKIAHTLLLRQIFSGAKIQPTFYRVQLSFFFSMEKKEAKNALHCHKPCILFPAMLSSNVLHEKTRLLTLYYKTNFKSCQISKYM